MVKIHTVTLDGKLYNIGYKVVTEDMESLGLRRNPNIFKYSLNRWYYDTSGFYLKRTFGEARRLVKYMKETYSEKTRVFKTGINQIIDSNSSSIIAKNIMLFEEIKLSNLVL